MAITFTRPLSAVIQNYIASRADLDSRAYNAQLAVEIVLQDATVLQYATKQLTMDSLSRAGASVAITPVNFIGKITASPEFRHSQTRTVDAGDLDIANLDYFLSALIPENARPFDNTFVTAYLCFPKASGNYEGVIYFIGQLNEIQGDDEVARISFISDLADKTSNLGQEISQRCMNTLGDAWCGVTNLPPGATCSNIWQDAENGCAKWGGVFNGVPFLNPNAISPYVYSGGGGLEPGSGWPDPPYCPDIESYFKSANGGYIHGKDRLVGEQLVDHKGRIVTVEAAEPVFCEYRYRISTSVGASIICSATSLLLTDFDDEVGARASNWRFEHYSLVTDTPQGVIVIAPSRPREDGYRFDVYSAGMCLKLTTTAPHIYLAGEKPGYYVAKHNTKWLPPIIGF